MLNFKPNDLQLDIQLSSMLSFAQQEPNDGIIQRYKAKLLVYNGDMADDPGSRASNGSLLRQGEYLEVGWLKFGVIDIDQSLNENVNLADASDATNQEYMNLYEALFYADSPALKAKVSQVLGDMPLMRGVLYLDRVFIEPAARGSQFGLAAIHTILRRFSRGCSVAALLPCPFGPEAEHLSVKEKARKSKDLARMYAGLGFRLVPRSDGYMVANLDNRLPYPFDVKK